MILRAFRMDGTSGGRMSVASPSLVLCTTTGLALLIPLSSFKDSCAYNISPLQSDAPVTVRTRQFITNRLLQRKQFVVDILHPSRPNVSKADLDKKLGEMYKADSARVVTFGLRTHFGGGRTTGFALIYDSEDAQRRFEPKFRLIRAGMATKTDKASRKLRKERKNRSKKVRQDLLSSYRILTYFQVRGTKKAKAAEPAKKGK
ncbi:hypothetical protein CALVIDRAFT_252426 [Calocera viscosa TUFC12733]|uniref:40S ribosomal protein S24 n=1 Tax=Calocera viscosa (strain TUFC12733) TaxID=1330018 RepID=A0A167JFZ4_CALVF|nr:hypothetical protein CALVIDRAFT_252426 [Calocera viscosa TUFC12733]